MINPIVVKIGTLELHAFTASVTLTVLIGVALVLLTAHRLQQPLLRWLDVALGAVMGGVIGARLFHVALEWTYFSAHTDQITVLTSGGLDWHGAVIGGLIGAMIIARLRGVPFGAFSDVIALAFPLGALATWSACGVAACAYGAEVRTLADFPAWLVVESPDVYGSVAPRLNLPQIGIWLGLIVYLLVLALGITRRANGLRFPIALAVFSLGMAFLDFFRGDYVIGILSRRADQILDLFILALAVLMIAAARIKNFTDGLPSPSRPLHAQETQSQRGWG